MLRLRPYRACDAKEVVSWIEDETAFYKWSASRLGTYPITAEELNQNYDALAAADDFFVMTAFDEMGTAGQVMMRFLDKEKRELRFGFIIVDSSRRGKGYGKEMLGLAAEYAFAVLKVERVTLGVFENNESACRCYASAGFQETGITEHYSVLGEVWTCKELELKRQVFMDNSRLEAFEKMFTAVQREYADILEKMEHLKASGKIKTVTYQQLMSRKMMYQNMLSLYEIYGLADETSSSGAGRQ